MVCNLVVTGVPEAQVQATVFNPPQDGGTLEMDFYQAPAAEHVLAQPEAFYQPPQPPQPPQPSQPPPQSEERAPNEPMGLSSEGNGVLRPPPSVCPAV